MSETVNQFEPLAQAEQVLNEIETKMFETASLLGRMQFLHKKLSDEFEKLRERADTLDCYTDADLAKHWHVSERTVADARRDLGLPHFTIGSKARYTREQVREITRILAVNDKGRLSLVKAA